MQKRGKKIHEEEMMRHRLVSTTSRELTLKIGYSSYHLRIQQALTHYTINYQQVKIFITTFNEFTELKILPHTMHTNRLRKREHQREFLAYLDAASRSSSCNFFNCSISSSFLFQRKSALFKSRGIKTD